MFKEKKYKDIINHCAKNNPDEYNKDKALEELMEFSEVIIKRQTKSDSNPKKPKKEELIKEFGDVIYRDIIYLVQEHPELFLEEVLQDVKKHIEHKLDNMIEYQKTGQYLSGI